MLWVFNATINPTPDDILNKDPKERYTYADNQVNIMSII